MYICIYVKHRIMYALVGMRACTPLWESWLHGLWLDTTRKWCLRAGQDARNFFQDVFVVVCCLLFPHWPKNIEQ